MKKTTFNSGGYLPIKHGLDKLFGIIFLIVLSPLMGLILIGVYINLGSPSIFKQTRTGYSGKRFTIYKFRTMSHDIDDRDTFLEEHERLTWFGQFLRASSLDELPQLFNILKGDMSFIGPRPLAQMDLKNLTDYQKRRHEVRPGLSGLAQVNGRNRLCWGTKFDLDITYIGQMSFILDLRILMMTFIKLFLFHEVNPRSSALDPLKERNI